MAAGILAAIRNSGPAVVTIPGIPGGREGRFSDVQMARRWSSRYNPPVSERKAWVRATGMALGAALLTTLPYALAAGTAPESSVFSGFLVNPLDGFSYLAKMRQGFHGAWLFQLPYAQDPGPGALIFTFYLALGHLSRLMGLALIETFHATRFVVTVLMGLAGYLFLRRAVSPGPGRSYAYALFLFGSGFGWIAGPLGWLTSDLLIPESIPLYSAFVNPHFPLALAAVAASAWLGLGERHGWGEYLAAGILGVVLGLVLPFAAMSLLAVLGLWSIWELARGWNGGERSLPASTGIVAALAMGCAPFLAYDLLLTLRHPVLAVWNQQNQTPSPPPLSFIAGYGPVLVFAIVGLVRNRVWQGRRGRLLVSWVFVNSLLLYAPFNLQRRLSLGLFLPLAALAGMGLRSVAQGRQSRHWVPALVVILALPSNLFAMAAGVVEVADGEPSLLLTPGERAGYRWIEENLAGSTILGAPRTGNRLPAYADVTVFYGHPFETPHADERRIRVESFYRSEEDGPGAAAAAKAMGADYFVLGPHEERLGAPATFSPLTAYYTAGGFRLYRVDGP